MGKSNIDPIIQDKMLNLATPMDKEALWAAIQPQVVAEPVVGSGISTVLLTKLGIGLLVMGLLSVGIRYYTLQGSTSVTSGSNATLNAPQNTQLQATNSESTTQIANPTTPVGAVIDDKLDQLPHSQTHAAMPADATTLSQVQKTSPSQAQNHLAKAKASPTTTPTSAENLTNTSTNSTPISASSNLNSANSTIFASSITIQSTASPSQTPNNTNDTPPTDELEISSNMASIAGINFFLIRPDAISLNMGEVSELEEEVCFDKKGNRVECYTYGKKKLPISLIAYYGPGATLRSLSNVGGSEAETYLNLRETTESMQENHRAGLLLKYKHESGIFLKAGLEIGKINERFDYKNTTQTDTLLTNVVVRYEVLADGTVVPVYGDVQGTLISGKHYIQNNAFTYIDIPIIAGYESSLGGNWSYAVEAGVHLNQSFKYEGYVFDTVTNEPVLNPPYWKSKTGLSLTGGVGIGYTLGKYLTLWATPSVRHTMPSVAVSTYLLDQKYTQVNLLFGAELKF